MQVDGDRFTAVVITKRHTDGLPTVFGNDQELELKLEGRCAGKIATYVGTAEQFPGVLLEGTLIFNEPRRAPETNGPTATFNPNKLPKLPARGR